MMHNLLSLFFLLAYFIRTGYEFSSIERKVTMFFNPFTSWL
jgi:hypothetical protein